MSKVVTYRPDIDSLRALAVLSVIIFHFDKTWLPGGFLGVDIFFVISGFLITLILHREMGSGSFSFKNFYIRRIKRILPAFFVVLISSVVIAAFLFTPADFRLLGQSAIASILFAANLYFARGQKYFDPAQDEKPLLHIWSLSVEEQYYFVFPLLLLLVIRKHWKIQFCFLAALMLLSLSASFLPTTLDKYYLPHLRAFEMLIGSITAVILQVQATNGKHYGEKLAAPASLAALCIILLCMFLYYPKMSYFPGWAGVLPCSAAAALIYFNRFDHRFKKWFEWKGTVTIGLLSYSLYLWHWPILAFARYISGTPVLPLSWILPLILIITIASVLTYVCVEKPFKKWQKPLTASIAYIYALPTAALAVAWFGFQQSSLMTQFSQQQLVRTSTSCHNNLDQQCIWGDADKAASVLMVGDSHADHYKTFIDYLGKKEGWAATLVSSDTCAYVTNYQAEVWNLNKNCQATHDFVSQHIHQYPVIMLAMRWGNQIKTDPPSISYDAEFFDKFDHMLAKLSQEKQAVYLFTDTPNIQYPALRSYKLEQILGKAPVNLQIQDQTFAAGNQKMIQLATKYPNVHIVDTLALLPADFRVSGKPVYFDRDHINPFGAENMAKRFAEQQTLLR